MPRPRAGGAAPSCRRVCVWTRASSDRETRCSAMAAGVGGMERMIGARSERWRASGELPGKSDRLCEMEARDSALRRSLGEEVM